MNRVGSVPFVVILLASAFWQVPSRLMHNWIMTTTPARYAAFCAKNVTLDLATSMITPVGCVLRQIIWISGNK